MVEHREENWNKEIKRRPVYGGTYGGESINKIFTAIITPTTTTITATITFYYHDKRNRKPTTNFRQIYLQATYHFTTTKKVLAKVLTGLGKFQSDFKEALMNFSKCS